YLEDLTYEVLFMMSERAQARTHKRTLRTLSCALMALGLLPATLPEVPYPASKKVAQPRSEPRLVTQQVAPEWLGYCQRWRATSTLTPQTRTQHYSFLLKTGRWLTQEHPEYLDPGKWTREFVAIFVAFVDRQRIGEWIAPEYVNRLRSEKVGQP